LQEAYEAGTLLSFAIDEVSSYDAALLQKHIAVFLSPNSQQGT
jgi:hypothetical protein